LPDGSESQQETGQVSEAQGKQPATAPTTRGTSEKKKAANRLNGQKSSGPNTVRGKANSRRNALTHCLLAQKALFDSKGMPQDEGYHALYLQLLEEYPGEDLITQLRRESLLAAYWRNVQSLRYERDLMERWGVEAFQAYAMPNLHRYSVANQKAFAARLQELEDTASLLVQPEDRVVGENADEAADDAADAATPMEEYGERDSSADVTAASTDSAMVDSEPGSSTSSNSALPAPAVEEVTPATEPQNESLDQSATVGPPQNSDAAAPAAWPITGEAEPEDESGAAPCPLIQ